MLSAGVRPVHGSEVGEWVLALHLHYVDLTAGRPSHLADVGAQIPERRPDSLALGHLDASLNPRVDPEGLVSAGINSSRGILASAEALLACLDNQVAILDAGVL